MMRQLRYTFTHMAQHTAANLFHRPCDGETKRMTVGRAVALDDDAAQAQQARAVVAALIDARLNALRTGSRDEPREFGEEVAGELLAQVSGEHLRDALGGLQRHIADEAVADDDVGRALVDIVAFDVAVEVEARWRAAVPPRA